MADSNKSQFQTRVSVYVWMSATQQEVKTDQHIHISTNVTRLRVILLSEPRAIHMAELACEKDQLWGKKLHPSPQSPSTLLLHLIRYLHLFLCYGEHTYFHTLSRTRTWRRQSQRKQLVSPQEPDSASWTFIKFSGVSVDGCRTQGVSFPHSN